MSIVVVDNRGLTLCKDNLFRAHPDSGTYPECVKTYRRWGNARNAAQRLIPRPRPTDRQSRVWYRCLSFDVWVKQYQN